MFRPDKICEADAGELLTDPVDIDAESIVVHIEPAVPEIIYDIRPGADRAGVGKEIVQDLLLVFCKFHLPVPIFQSPILRVENSAMP